MRLVRQPPVWSPLTLGAILAGVRAAWLGGDLTAREALDKGLRSSYGPRQLFLTDSGTSALTLALQAATSATRAPIALPAYCCYDIATAADGAEIDFHLCDIEPATLSPDLASLRKAFESGARTVVVAHLYGVPVDLEAVERLASEFGAIVIEDAAQGSGCVWKGRPAGAHGAMGVLSFGRGKGVTGGGGGALLVNDPGLVAAASAAWHASVGPRSPRGTVLDLLRLMAQWLFGRPGWYWIPASLPFLGLGETRYQAPHPAGGISAMAAGVLTRTIGLVPEEVRRRRDNAERLRAGVTGGAVPEVPEGWEAGWLRLPVVLQRTAAGMQTPYYSSLGVMRGYPGTLADLDGFGVRRLNPSDAFAGARLLVERLVTLPTHRFVRSARIAVF